MKKDELLITCILASVLMAGAAFQFYRGGEKNADVIFVSGDHTPFEDIDPITPAEIPVQLDGQPVASPTLSEISLQATPVPPQTQNQFTVVLQWLNQATADDFQRISGIGEQTANKIVAYRKENNGFNAIEQLKDVAGIGDKRVADIIQHIQIQLRNTNTTLPTSQPEKTSQPVIKTEIPTKNISINKATVAQLQTVSGIGPQMAKMIVEERTKHSNGFQNWNQLQKISGVGDARIKLLQQHFTLE